MNNGSIEEEIEGLYTRLVQAKNASKHLNQLGSQIEDLEMRQVLLKKQMQKEHEDVLALEKKSLINIFSDILGNLNEQLEIERQEYLQAVLQYRSISEELELAGFEYNILLRKHNTIPKLERELSSGLQIKEQKIRFHNKESARKIKDFNLLIDLRKSRIIEIKEALEIGKKASEQVEQILNDLRKVQNFGNSSLMQGRGKYSSYKKKTYIDHSQKKALKINALLQRFEQELKDIYKDHLHEFHISEFENFIANFYDHLITDWIIQHQLNSAISSTVSVSTKINRLLIMVDAELKAEALLLENNKKEKNLYILDKIKD